MHACTPLKSWPLRLLVPPAADSAVAALHSHFTHISLVGLTIDAWLAGLTEGIRRCSQYASAAQSHLQVAV